MEKWNDISQSELLCNSAKSEKSFDWSTVVSNPQEESRTRAIRIAYGRRVVYKKHTK